MFFSKRVQHTAKEVRKHFERIAQSENFSATLDCLCYRASFALSKRLQAKSFKAKVVHGMMLDTRNVLRQHAWVVCSRTIIDITATQFGYRNHVFVMPVTSKLYKPRKKLWPKYLWPVEQQPRKNDYEI